MSSHMSQRCKLSSEKVTVQLDVMLCYLILLLQCLLASSGYNTATLLDIAICEKLTATLPVTATWFDIHSSIAYKYCLVLHMAAIFPVGAIWCSNHWCIA